MQRTIGDSKLQTKMTASLSLRVGQIWISAGVYIILEQQPP